MSALPATRSETSEVARHIARVAARLFATHGYDATSVREIVEEAGVTKPTLYYHFGSKEGLAQALLNQPLEEMSGKIRAILDEVADPVEALAQTFEAHFAFCRGEPDRCRFFFALFFGPGSTGLAAEMARIRENHCDLMELAVRKLVDGGVVAEDRFNDCVQACHGLKVITTMDFMFGGGEPGPGLGHRMVRDLLWGFGRRRGDGPEDQL